jgi:uncharacterized protein (TIRG00374 family)
MQALPLGTALIVLSAYALNAILKALRWHRMLQHQGVAIGWRTSIAAFMSGAFYGMLTIGRVGELMRAEALLEHAQSKTDALANAIADRLLDAGFLVCVAVSCCVLLHGAWPWSLLAVVTLACALALGLQSCRRRLAMAPTPTAELARERTRSPARPAAMERVLTGARGFGRSLGRILFGPGTPEALIWTLVSWSAYFFAVARLATGLGIDAPLLALVGAIAAGTASAALPISFQGLGTREAVLAATLAPYGISTTKALTFSLLTLAVFYAVMLPLGGLGIAWRQHQRGAANCS